MSTEQHIKQVQEDNLLASSLEALPDVFKIRFASIFGTEKFVINGEIMHIGAQKKTDKVFEMTVRQIEELFEANKRKLGFYKFGMSDDFGHCVSMYRTRKEIEIVLHKYIETRGQALTFVVYLDINKIAFYPQVKNPEQISRFEEAIRGVANGE